MDKEQEELQVLGFFGIWRETFKIINEYREIFLHLGLALTLPLSFIYLAHMEIIYLLMQNTSSHMEIIYLLMQNTSRKMGYILLIELMYTIFVFLFSLLPTSAIFYTVACIYTGKKVGFKDVMRVIPKVWKRLIVTSLSALLIMFVYSFLFLFVVFIIIFIGLLVDSDTMMKLIFICKVLAVLYVVSSFYMIVIWQLANPISVLEECYGFQALKKSKILIKGKMGILIAILFVTSICYGVVLQVYNSFVVESHYGILSRVGLGIIALFTLCLLLLLGLVVHTVLYLVCKSYHHEHIDKTALADHLEIYHGEGYILLKPNDIQLMDKV